MNAAANESPKYDIPVDDFVDLLKARIDIAHRWTEAKREFVAANEREQRRQFKFHTNRARREMVLRRARHKTHRTLVCTITIVTVATVWFLFHHAFYGDAHQQQYAPPFIKYLAIGLAGYGIISGVAGLFRRLLKSPEA